VNAVVVTDQDTNEETPASETIGGVVIEDANDE